MVGFKSVFLAYFEDISFAFLQQLNLYGKASWKTGALRKHFLFDIFIMRMINLPIFGFSVEHTFPKAQMTPELFF